MKGIIVVDNIKVTDNPAIIAHSAVCEVFFSILYLYLRQQHIELSQKQSQQQSAQINVLHRLQNEELLLPVYPCLFDARYPPFEDSLIELKAF